MPSSNGRALDLKSTRTSLQAVATHVLSRARFADQGRIGLRVGAGCIATPTHGSDAQVLRLTSTTLIVESAASGVARSRVALLSSSTMRQLAEFAGVDLAGPLEAGGHAPPIGNVDQPIAVDVDAARAILHWFRVGSEAIDRVLATAVDPSVTQLWPEHFDVSADLATRCGRVNIGASPGDGEIPHPYAYVGPWEDTRPGDPDYWNARFGSALPWDVARDAKDPAARVAEFFQRGLELLGA
jgi:hypothetical protein